MSFNYKSKEFYINLDKKDIPPENHPDFLALRDWERKKCKEGVTINGVHIWGSLYYTLNHHTISIDIEDGDSPFILKRPEFRDNEFIIHEAYNKAKEVKLGLCIGAGRQSGKSEFIVSESSRQLFLYQNSEVVAVFTTKPDKDTFTKKLQIAIQQNSKFLVVPNIDQDFTKDYIRFGITQTNNEPFIFSKLYVYLNDSGTNTEVAAGKMLPQGTKVFYENKEGNIEDCKIGDKIFGRNGKLTTITAVHHQDELELYEITFSDNRKIVCCKDHLWTVYRMDYTGVNTPKEITVDTQFLFENYKRKYYNSKLKKEVEVNRYKIPKNECIEYPKQDVLIDPYYFGLWLGDGSSAQPNHITSIDQEIIDYVEKYGKTFGCNLETRKQGHRIKYKEKGMHPLNKLFFHYNLKNNKHIPDEYLRNSEEVRLELLRGLMDTDGGIDKNGKIQIDLSDKKLADDVIFLIRSLGIECTVTSRIPSYKDKNGNKKLCKTSYRIYLGIITDKILFKLSRKLNKTNKIIPKQSNQFGASIIDIKPAGKGCGTCISVDNEDKLYLAGDFIPTHNTISFFVMDEIAKNKMKETYEAVLPAIKGKFGLRCSPVLVFTGGNVEKSKDAEGIYFNPDSNKLLSFENENKKTGLFLTGEYQMGYKDVTTAGKFYSKKNNIYVPDDSELNEIEFWETNFEKANYELDKEEKLAKEESLVAYQKRKMYSPRNIRDMFLKVEQNPFSKFLEEFEKLLKFLETQELKKVDFESNGKPIDSSKKPLFDYPYNKNEIGIFDTPLCVVDEPRLISGTKLYVGGLDPYNTIKTAESASLGSFYIMRRETSDYSDSYNSRIVAWYNGRKDITSFRKLLTNTLLYYGVEQGCVTMLHEAADDNLTQHYTEKNKGYYLEDTYTLSREINPNSTSFNSKGLRPTPRTQAYYLQLILDYCEEELEDGRLGLWRIPDPYLIKQLMNFDGDLSDKDSLVSFGHALIHLKKESKYRPNVSERVEVKEKPKVINNAFGNSFKTYKKSAI